MSIFADYRSKCRMIGDRRLPGEARAFAALECVFQPVSFLTVLAAAANAVAGFFGMALLPSVLVFVFPVLLSAAVGYLTNWVAIEMLFKPYRQTLRHPFAWMTFGYWRQGLVPKNKDRLAVEMGSQVAEKLLKPEKLADDLCSMVGGVLENKEIIAKIQDVLQRQILAHDKEIVDALSPKIEEALVAEIDRLVTEENVQKFWRTTLEPKLQSRETREKVAAMIIGALDKRAPALAAKVKPMIVKSIEGYITECAGPLAGPLLAPLAGGIADFIVNQKTIEGGLRKWMQDPSTVPAVRDELLHFVTALRTYLKSAEAQGEVGGFVRDIRGQFKNYVHVYLESHFSSTVQGILRSEPLWQWAASMLPKFKPELERLIHEQGMPLILEKLNIQGRIKTAVDAMDVAEFHGMVNDVAAQHLGAIQVLGYLLGALAGGLMLLVRG